LIVHHNLPRNEFVSLYRRCAAIVGNSSSIVIESSFLKTPGILIGDRQNLREISSNIIRVDTSEASVKDACLKVINDNVFIAAVNCCSSLYGDGNAASRIVKKLVEVELNKSLLHKTINY